MGNKEKNYLTKRDVGKIFRLSKNAVNLVFNSRDFPLQDKKMNGRETQVVEATDCIVYFGYNICP